MCGEAEPPRECRRRWPGAPSGSRGSCPGPGSAGLSASSAAIPAEFLGKTFIYSGGSYVVSAQTGAPANGVRFRLYAIDPVTLLPAVPLNQTGYVDLIDLSSGATSAARVIVVSGTTTYLDYRVSATAPASDGRVTVLGFITDGATELTFNLRATLTFDAGLTLTTRSMCPSAISRSISR